MVRVAKNHAALTRQSGRNKRTTAKVKQTRHRWKSGTVALREIRKYQKSTELLIQKAPFQRLLREVTMDTTKQLQYMTDPPRVTVPAVECFQTASEAIITKTLGDANLCAIHAKRVTVQPKDLKLVLRLIQEPCLRARTIPHKKTPSSHLGIGNKVIECDY